MARRWTWKVIKWEAIGDREPTDALEMVCPRCGRAADMPTFGDPGSPVIASIGLDLVFDKPDHVPPKTFVPEEVQCRDCRYVFKQREEINVEV